MTQNEEAILILKCCIAAQRMLEASGIRGVIFEPNVMKKFIEVQSSDEGSISLQRRQGKSKQQ